MVPVINSPHPLLYGLKLANMKTITAKWFECSVRFEKTDELGHQKKVTEQYVVDAQSFTEAEARVIQELVPFISGVFEVSGIKQAPYAEIAFSDCQTSEHKYYKIKVAFILIDEKTGREKHSNTQMLVQGESLHDALNRVDEVLRGSMADYISVNAVSTKIVDVFLHT